MEGYTPPGYSGDRKYPVLYLLHGIGGNEDGLMTFSLRTRAYLKEKGVPHIWHVDDSAHDFNHWKSSLYWCAQQLFR